MPSVRRGHAQQQSLNLPAHKFRTVLGIAALRPDPDDTTSDSDTAPPANPSLIRRSVDLVGSYASHKKHKHTARKSIADASFFEPISTVIIDSAPPPPNPITMKEPVPDNHNRNHTPQSRPARRPVLRMDAQDGPWSVSVAENPGDSTSYSLYVKTPTHNLTLSRTAHEIVDLHHKLHDSYPSVKLPALPIDANSLPQPAKRKSAFLNTLSRLASPASKSSAARHASKPSLSGSSPRSAAPSVLATPLGSPGQESNDPFSSFGDEAPLSSPTASTNPLLTGLAAYLTTVSNDQLLRQARVWKRFVRVRTDDLESVRVERAIKRVRSDLAAHMTSPSTVDVQMLSSSVTSSVNGDAEKNEEENGDGVLAEKPALGRRDSRFREHIDEKARDELEPAQEEEAEEPAAVDGDEVTAEERPETPRSPKKPIEDAAADDEADSVVTNGIDEGEKTPSTPVAGDTVASRIPRSQSADPDKAARLSRIFSASSTKLDGTSSPQSASASASQTEDDASIGTSHAARKKRSKSADPKRQLSQRKVQVSDFEMLRVLGKGCAGKVLLVRHRSSADLYALKAITKRHVLAHQELQHTLTEQAVLKRMAAEGADPFVVKLWWSFHDKENLFLVMDFHPGGDLATQLARWGRLGRDRARFYAAEIVEGVEGLHNAGVIYRDLKPENILIAADGHIVLTDFGLSKEFPRRSAAITAPSTPNGQRNGFQTASQTPPATPYWMNGNGEERSQDLAQPWPSRGSDATSTFCGTAEYLAPEVIQGLPYSYEVDWWSFGTMLYEILAGILPFGAVSDTRERLARRRRQNGRSRRILKIAPVSVIHAATGGSRSRALACRHAMSTRAVFAEPRRASDDAARRNFADGGCRTRCSETPRCSVQREKERSESEQSSHSRITYLPVHKRE
ncbi:kinase-like protein [Dentipellis sp. KUC8613]|nr:kinase-like protein [Dentipellis sp. KUC8613]